MPVTEPTSLESRIREEMERSGPMPFERFMDLALYAPGLGYYVRAQDPFGMGGDFFTAEQLQPVFGILIAQWVAEMRLKMGSPADFAVVEAGAGRGEMGEALAEFAYKPVDISAGQWPERIHGVVLANEFLDALPVRVAVRRGAEFRDVNVMWKDDRFHFVDGEACSGDTLAYLERFYGGAEEGATIEVHLRALDWLERTARSLAGTLLVIDYGYTAREFPRYNTGTLMSYRHHRASEDVLMDPGTRDITAHVPFSVVEQALRGHGLEVEPLETMAHFLLRVGEPDQFAAALEADDAREQLKRRMQLKTLLFGMGETFRVLVANSITQ